MVTTSIPGLRTIGWFVLKWAGIPLQYVTNHRGQLSLLPSVRRGMSISQSAVMHCGWE